MNALRRETTTLVPAAALAVCLLAAFTARADDAAGTAEKIRTLVVDLDQAYASENAATIRRMLTPDHVSIAARYDGAAAVDAQLGTFEDLERRNLDYSAIDVEFLAPDIALVNFEKSYRGSYKGAALPGRVSVSEVWLEQQDGRWLQRLYQETAIAGQ